MTALVRLLAVGLLALTLSAAAEAAHVSPGVKSIRIRSATGITTIVTPGGVIREIVQAFDALPRFVARPCPSPGYAAPDVSFDFRTADGRVVIHAVDHAPGTCGGSITYTEGHVKHAALADDNFVARLAKLIGDIDPIARTVANERLAERDAPRLLRLAVMPPGSRPVSMPLIKALADSGSPPVVASDVDLQRIRKVRMPVSAVFAFERAHAPRGARITRIDTGGGYRAHPHSAWHTTAGLTFSFPAFKHRVKARELSVSIVSLTPHWTGIRIDASDEWVVARAPNEVVPAGVRTITVRRVPPPPTAMYPDPKGKPRLAHRVTSRRQVATIIRWFDKLPVSQESCGPYIPPQGDYERIAFLDGSGHVLARANAYPYGAVSGTCTPIEFSIGGKSFAPLLGGRFLIRVERLLR